MINIIQRLHPDLLQKVENTERYVSSFSRDSEKIQLLKLYDITEICNLFFEKWVVDFNMKVNIINRLLSSDFWVRENALHEAKIWILLLNLWFHIESERNFNGKSPEFYMSLLDNCIELITPANSGNYFAKDIQDFIERSFPRKSNNFEFYFNSIPRWEDAEKEIKKQIRTSIQEEKWFSNTQLSFYIREYTQWVNYPYRLWMRWMLKLSTTVNKNYIFSYDEIFDFENQIKRKHKQIREVQKSTLLFIEIDSSILPSYYDELEKHLRNLITERHILTSWVSYVIIYTSWYSDHWYYFHKKYCLRNPCFQGLIDLKLLSLGLD
jgi:hypothetical protein